VFYLTAPTSPTTSFIKLGGDFLDLVLTLKMNAYRGRDGEEDRK